MSESMDVEIAKLRKLVRDLYADLIDADECCTSWAFREYALRVNDCGVDASRLGVYEVKKDIRLYRQLEKQVLDPSYRYSRCAAQKYREAYENLIAIAEAVGMDVSGDDAE